MWEVELLEEEQEAAVVAEVEEEAGHLFN